MGEQEKLRGSFGPGDIPLLGASAAAGVNTRGMRFDGASVLITGGLGMLGSWIAHKVVAAGCADLTVLDAQLSPLGANSFNLRGIERQTTLAVGDIRDPQLIASLVQRKDIIFNLAAQVSHNSSMEDPFTDLDINCRGQLTLLEACRRLNTGARVVFAGSRLQYGQVESIPVSEEHPLRPKSPYAVHKSVGELYHQYYWREHGLPTTVLRITNPYGPRGQMRHSQYGMINWFVRKALDGEALTVFGEGRQIRDYVYAEDVADAFLTAATADAAVGEIFNVGSGHGTPFAEMARAVVDVAGSGTVESRPWPREYHAVETGDFVADVRKIGRLGWHPRVALPEGLRATMAYYRANRDSYW